MHCTNYYGANIMVLTWCKFGGSMLGDVPPVCGQSAVAIPA